MVVRARVARIDAQRLTVLMLRRGRVAGDLPELVPAQHVRVRVQRLQLVGIVVVIVTVRLAAFRVVREAQWWSGRVGETPKVLLPRALWLLGRTRPGAPHPRR